MDRNQRSEAPRELRSTREINLMRRAGLVVWQAHQAAARRIQPGVTTAQIDQAVADVFLEFGSQPLFLNYPGPGGPFPAVTCISLNEEIVHGIPGDRALREGDIVTIDTGCSLAGWCGDAAYTHAVGKISDPTRRLLEVTLETLNLAIERLATQSTWRPIAETMARHVRSRGCSVVESLVGHGIGKRLHEPPQVPNYFDEGASLEDFAIRPGLVIAIEPMVNAGSKQTRVLPDRWTVVTADGQPSAHFEHTVAITAQGPRRLTASPVESELEFVLPQFRDPSTWLNW